jgi:prepilin-type N-terminal cleavage/methylation domain-containing protein
MKKLNQPEKGFSLLETLIVIGIMSILASIAIFKSFGTMESYQSNSAMDIVVSQLRVARQLAISQRRNVQVTFNTSATSPSISYTVLAGNYAGSTEVNGTAVKMPLPNQLQFTSVPGEVDTPMAFGTCGGNFGVCIAGVSGGPAIMGFNSQGQFTDSTWVNTLNGTVFIGIPNQGSTARAVTVMGGTGRVRSYSYAGGTGAYAWTE